jgi:hypothetical protein
MFSNRIKRTDAEVVFGIFRNLHSATLGDGEVAIMLTSADTPPTGYTFQPGVDVKQSGGVSLVIAGVVKGSIVQGEYGRIQAYGHHPNVKCTAATPAAGTILTSDAAGAVVAGATADDPSARIGVVTVLGASNRAGVQIRCM